jgi:DNA-binding CsgD family transcriptional regulator
VPAVTELAESTFAQLSLELCELARQRADLTGYRNAVIALLLPHVPFDVAVFHEFSPRISLSRAALHGVTLATLEAGRARWDENAVLFGRLRELALEHGGVAADREAFAADTRARTAWRSRVCQPLGMQSALLAHLVVNERLVSALLLGRRTTQGFAVRERRALSRVLPAIALGDALQQSLLDGHVAGPPTQLRCEDQRLTPRQRELVERVALGHTNAEIGRALNLSQNTVRNLLAETRQRLGAANRAELVRLAVLR